MQKGSTMEGEMALAEDLLHAVVEFLENGNVDTVVEGEVLDLFRMCKQIEIYDERFVRKGYFMSMNIATGRIRFSRSDVSRTNRDSNNLADKLFMKFCQPSTPSGLLYKALNIFLKEFGAPRLERCVKELSGLEDGFCVKTTISRANQYNTNLVATLMMEGYGAIIRAKRNGMARVKELLRELVIEYECAETVVAMFAVEKGIEPQMCHHIKEALLEQIQKKYKRVPRARLWVKMVSSIAIIDSVNAYEPFLEFIISLVKSLSNSITCVDVEKKEFYSPPGALSYDALVNLITSCYANSNYRQRIINAVFEQCGANPTVWFSVLYSCHNVPAVEQSAPPFSDDAIPVMRSHTRALEWK